jgi:hypothetical protein
MTDELKACPFCGGEAEKPYKSDVKCNNRMCPAYYFVTWMPEKTWNTRPIEDALLKRAERAEAMVEKLIEAGGEIVDEAQLQEPDVSDLREAWQALVAEWQARNDRM